MRSAIRVEPLSTHDRVTSLTSSLGLELLAKKHFNVTVPRLTA